MTKEQISKLMYDPMDLNDLWRVSIVYASALDGIIEHTTAYFVSRFDAENWYGDYITSRKLTAYYSFVCGNNYWKNVEMLLDK